MKYLAVYNRPEQLPVSSEWTFPAKPFPRNYVHSVVDDLFYAVRAVHALRSAGYAPEDIHVMASWDYIEAVANQQKHQRHLSTLLARIGSFLDGGFRDGYLCHALRGRHILTTRLTQQDQVEHVRTLLVQHNAYCIKYVDLWTITELPSHRA